MEAITRVLKDVQASAKEFAALGLSASSKALERASAHLKKVEASLKPQPEAAVEKTAAPTPTDTAK